MGCIPVLILSGCERQEIHSYRVAREFNGSTPSAPQPASSTPVSPQVSWAPPSSWQEAETTSSMRIATYRASNGLEIAVTAFPGDVGGLLANVNRWRGQVGLDPIDEGALNESVVQLEGIQVQIVDIKGVDKRLVGSIMDVGDGQTWFAKVMGDSDAVELIKAELVTFSTTFHIHRHDDDHSSPPSNAAPSALNTTEPELPEPSSWEQPSQWQVEENASSILLAAFNAQSGARITLTSLIGDGGGMLGNINRWRGQLGLEIMTSMADLPVRDLGDGAVFVDLQSVDTPARMAAGIVPVGGQTLFFKLTGTSEQVESELARFEHYVNIEGLRKGGQP